MVIDLVALMDIGIKEANNCVVSMIDNLATGTSCNKLSTCTHQLYYSGWWQDLG